MLAEAASELVCLTRRRENSSAHFIDIATTDQPVLPRFLVPFVRRLEGCNGTGQLASVSRVLLR